MIYVAGLIAILVIAVIVQPFVFGEGGALAPAATESSVERLFAAKQSILKRYLEEERAHLDGDISKGVWSNRRQFLTNRYLDTARRIDYLQSASPRQVQSSPQTSSTKQAGGGN